MMARPTKFRPELPFITELHDRKEKKPKHKQKQIIFYL